MNSTKILPLTGFVELAHRPDIICRTYTMYDNAGNIRQSFIVRFYNLFHERYLIETRFRAVTQEFCEMLTTHSYFRGTKDRADVNQVRNILLNVDGSLNLIPLHRCEAKKDIFDVDLSNTKLE